MKDDLNTEVRSSSNPKIYNQDIQYVKENMLSEKTFMKLSELFKILGDYTRIKIIYSLSKKELCVYDIAEVVKISQSAISHQLRILKAARLVKFRREGKLIYYSLDDEHIDRLFNAGLEHVEHN